MESAKEYIIDFVTSNDGTKIGYRQFGSGPGVILVPGGMMAAQNFMKLAQSLATDFTVYVPDRQGRATSGTRTNHSLIAESKDIQAFINKTKAENIFGLSSGAIVVLQTAINTPSLKKIALYEPPIALNKPTAAKWYTQYELAIAKGDLGKAFRCVFKCVGDTSWLTSIPAFIIVPLMRLALKGEDKKVKGDDASISSLIAAFKYDYRIVLESAGIVNRSGVIKGDVLLIGGAKSEQFLKDGLIQLAEALPNAAKTELAGVGHIAADNSGKPELVAKGLKNFFES